MPWFAVAIRMMHHQKFGMRLPWPMVTPHINRINETNPQAIGMIEGYIDGFDWRLDPFRQFGL
jgi:hypothetical protein